MSVAAGAQQVNGTLSMNGGSGTDQRGVRSNAVTMSPSLVVIPDPRLSVGLSATATRFQSSDWAAGAGVTGGTRLPIAGGFAFSASASGSATTTSFQARYLAAELTPTAELAIGRVTLFGGAHLAHGQTSVQVPTTPTTGPLGGSSAATRSEATARSSAGPVYGGVLAIPTDDPEVGGSMVYREEQMRIAALTVVDRAVTASWSAGPLALSASAGSRSAPDENVGFGSLATTVSMTRGVAVQAAVGSYPSSRILGTPGGRYASLGFVLRGSSGDVERELGKEVVRGAPPVPHGATRLVMRAPSAKRVELAGDWNGWTPVAATPGSDGSWYADVRLPRGDYRYAFRIDGGRWAVPDGSNAVDDGYGGRSALLIVH
jgi:hypothetical protein